MKYLIVFCALFAFAYAAKRQEWLINNPDVELPEGFLACQRDSPDRNICIKQSIQSLIPKLHRGIPQLNFPAIDPLSIDIFQAQYETDQISAAFTIKQAKTYGIARAQIRDVRSEITDTEMDLEVDVFFPRIFMEGTYKGEGRFNSLLLNSKGIYNVSMTEVATTWKMSGAIAERSGEKYMKIKKFDMTPTVGDMKVFATGLLPDPVLNNIAIEFFNQYWPIVYRELLPTAKSQWEPIMIDFVNRMFLNVPFRRLLLS